MKKLKCLEKKCLFLVFARGTSIGLAIQVVVTPQAFNEISRCPYRVATLSLAFENSPSIVVNSKTFGRNKTIS